MAHELDICKLYSESSIKSNANIFSYWFESKIVLPKKALNDIGYQFCRSIKTYQNYFSNNDIKVLMNECLDIISIVFKYNHYYPLYAIGHKYNPMKLLNFFGMEGLGYLANVDVNTYLSIRTDTFSNTWTWKINHQLLILLYFIKYNSVNFHNQQWQGGIHL